MFYIKILRFEDIEDLCCHMADSYDFYLQHGKDDVAVIAKYDDMQEIIRELMCIGYGIHSADFHDETWENYKDEYICTILNNELWIEKLRGDNGYIEDASNVIYVLDDCSSSALPYLYGNIMYEVHIADEDDFCDGDYDCVDCEFADMDFMCDGDCDGCEMDYLHDDDDDMHGFSCSFDGVNGYSTVSFYSSDKELVDEIARMYMK